MELTHDKSIKHHKCFVNKVAPALFPDCMTVLVAHSRRPCTLKEQSGGWDVRINKLSESKRAACLSGF